MLGALWIVKQDYGIPLFVAQMNNTIAAIPLRKLLGFWVLSGIVFVIFSLIYVRLGQVPVKYISINEGIRFLHGAIFLAGGLWALSVIGFDIRVGLGKFKENSNSELGIALKYFLIYVIAAAAAVGALYLIAALADKTGLISMDMFTGQANSAVSEKLTQKTYLRDILGQSPAKLCVYLFATCILVPIEEEIFMRRLLYGSLRATLRVWPSLLISSLIFGAVHPGGGAIPAFIAGLFLGWIYEKRKNLIVNSMVHGLINFSVTAALLLLSA